MTEPSRSQWPLTPALRLTALAMILVAAALLTQGWVSTVLLVGAAVVGVLAATKLAANWRRRR